ncbi:MAG: Tryptophan-rich sensory protein [Candidatus Woesebacteria bacterium GW2011_GWB1_39_10]|uniref:Tryptophan-rich sensory protein n=3 Tax=Candidatus Woeseibacteriota TaxID=1752722 RepID=A0A0G0PQY0_9BACT|nr:MAG: Tryptophan-rich sensory protein [Candidatus Woesebacteria bacterium GW2011_GWB1_39_10]
MRMMDLSWYNTLNKPFFTPPSWLFGPAWTVLYILMGVSAYLVWKKGFKKKQIKEALKIFAIQFVLNLSWSPIFFGAKQIFLALIVIIIMWIIIFKTIKVFAKIDKTASYLLYPYILWVSFATILNFSVWLLNK